MTLSEENANIIFTVIMLSLASLGFRALLITIGQRWVSTFSHTATLLLLPIITFCITKVISGNIALSLGMVGALSIVRFRNPVRSPLELTVYFGAITLGITASVSEKWTYVFIVSVFIAIGILWFISKFTELITKRPFFNMSFTEGNSMSTLEVLVSSKVDDIENSNFLVGKLKSEEGINYSLASPEFRSLKKLSDLIDEDPKVIKSNLNA